jgi:aspartyl-tRNA(Asn)/glutamyl-tRNA(Gln) amidotransferase subunit C
MSINVEEVTRVAALARLNPPQDKLDQFADQISDILGYMQMLNELDTTGVEPLYSPVDHGTVFREDSVGHEFSRADLLANAARTNGQYFIVPRIVG